MKYYVVQRCLNHKRKAFFASFDTFEKREEALSFYNNKKENFKNYPCYVKGDIIETVMLDNKQILELQKDY